MRYDDLKKFKTDQPIVFHFEREVVATDELLVEVTVTVYLVQGQVVEWVLTHNRDGDPAPWASSQGLPPVPQKDGIKRPRLSTQEQRWRYMQAQCKEYCEEVVDALKVHFPDAIFTGPAVIDDAVAAFPKGGNR
jgi:hypothetical protein